MFILFFSTRLISDNEVKNRPQTSNGECICAFAFLSLTGKVGPSENCRTLLKRIPDDPKFNALLRKEGKEERTFECSFRMSEPNIGKMVRHFGQLWKASRHTQKNSYRKGKFFSLKEKLKLDFLGLD